MDLNKNEHESTSKPTDEVHLLGLDVKTEGFSKPTEDVIDDGIKDDIQQIEEATAQLIELDNLVHKIAEEKNMELESITQKAEIVTLTTQIDENTEMETVTTITTEEAKLISHAEDKEQIDEDGHTIDHDTAKVVVQKSRQVVEIHHKPAIDEAYIEEQLFKEKLAICKIPETLLSSFKDRTNYLDLSEVDEAYDALEKEARAKLDSVLDNQTKIYNKILWINILAEKITADNDPKAIKFDDKGTVKKCEELQKFEIEVSKAKGYLNLLSARMKKAEKELDAYFYNLLKAHQMTENNLI